ncbi:methyl-accepting chemotaxis protein [Thiomicrorhabdus sp. zzn3]|uniref:methyl-accepting chemotaxis protein n=1 Tax=Thiomicrorhabdus sp. zzn3 TaxID=3039775 RepID=UPI00243645E9|nr:methyl-accepting chemotaxis protein [Thiomicrorhabdus sp. zzn3]MDG6778995.1 methyl-accepting chemotaxis protein [Thiomicrorhabdus sp. zzn3]
MKRLFADMSLKTKLLIAFLLVAIIPFGVISLVSLDEASTALEKQAYNQLEAVRSIKKAQIERYFEEREGDMGVLLETVDAIRYEAVNKLVAVRENKKKTITNYLQTIENQLVNMAGSPAIINAVRDFSQAYNQLPNDIQGVNANSIQSQLGQYYASTFTREYQKQSGQEIKASKFVSKLDASSSFLQYHYIVTNPNPLGSKQLQLESPAKTHWDQVHKQYHLRFKDVLDKFGYYDIFLVDNLGNVIYSVFKEVDFATNLQNGPWKASGLANAWRSAMQHSAGEAAIEDFSLYTPSYDAPAGFMAAPVFSGDERLGSLIFQMPLDKITETMSERAGLGKTGETYLIGADKLMRSDSYVDPQNHSVVSSFRNPQKGSVDTVAAQKALSGESGVDVIRDYNGNPVISAYAPLNYAGLQWAILSEVDIAEAFVPHAEGSSKDFYQKYIEKYGYYDLFLMNPDGFVFYSAAKEADYQTNMVNGKFASSNLGELTRKVLQTKQFAIADFSPYAPSNGEPAAFIAQPVMHGGKIDMIVALQLPLEGINGIMTNRQGMGETGETYLVGQDLLMRSDSYLDPTYHAVKTSFANPQKGKVETEASMAALNGQSDSRIILDYNGSPVLSSFTPVKVGDFTWALLAEIDQAEAFASVYRLQNIMLIVAVVIVIAIVLVALIVVRSITRPVSALMETMTDVQSSGDFRHRAVISSRDEIGQMGEAFNGMLESMQAAINEANTVVTAIARGDFEQRVSSELKGDLETLKQGVNGSAESVAFTMNELRKVMQGLYDGDFSVRMDNRVEAAFRDMVDQSMNAVNAVVADINQVMEALNQGDFSARVESDARGDLLAMKSNVNDSMVRLETAVQAITEVVIAQSEGDLTGVCEGDFRGQLKSLQTALNASSEKLKETISQAVSATQVVSTAASEVSQGAMDLSQRVQEQAAALEETSATMDEMNSAVQANTENAQKASHLAMEVQSKSSSGTQVMQQTLDAMNEIQESSNKISDIVNLIDGIAFQTNLLALNAAVEAARAGEHGRGFAVVAGEVRSLAQKSAEAAKDIKNLIEETVQRVNQGSELAGESGAMLQQINQSIESVTQMVEQIAKASEEQSSGVNQVHQAISQIDQVTQQNAALVEQTTAAAESMTDQAETLSADMAFFNTGAVAVQPTKVLESKKVTKPAPALPKAPASTTASKTSPTQKTLSSPSSAQEREEWSEF